nr:hypothetical protein [Tanacetum cinerariifolium]
MEDTMLELVKICRQKELLCIYDNVDDLIESALNTKLLLINSQHLDNKEHEVKNVVEQPAKRRNHSIESLQNFRVVHKSSISLKNSSQIYPIHADPSYNQNYNDNYPHDLPSFPYCDNCGESHETFQCQPMAQNIDFSGSDQIQTPQYPEIYPPSQKISDEVFQANHSVQYKENLENSSNSNQEKEGPLQDSNIRHLIREECCVEASEEQKQNMEDTMLELEHKVKNLVEQPTERRNHIESLQNFRVIHKSSISLNTSQISSIHAIATILSNKEHEYSSSMGYEHLSITPKTESDEVTESNVENLLPIPSECEVTLEHKRECDMFVCEDTSASDDSDDHSKIFSDSNNDDDISVYNDDFEDIEYVEASLPELVEICRQKELLCIHDNVDDLIESALNSQLLSINSQRLDNKEQKVKNVVEQPAERGNRSIESLQNFRVIQPEYSPSMGYEHPNTTPETKSDEIIKSGVEELVPVLSENEVTSEDKKECDMPVCENSPICDNHSEIFSDSNKDDDISSDEDAFEDIEYVEASLSDPEIVSVAEKNVVYQEEEEVDLEDISEIQDIVLCEKLFNITRLIANIESLNDNPTPDCVLNFSVSIPTSEESDNSLSDNFSPEFETFCDHMEETRSGNTTTHADYSFPEYDSFCFEIEPEQDRLINVVKNDISNESSNDPLLEEADLFLAFDNSIPPEPPDAETDAGEEIPVVMNDNDELECLDLRDEIDEVDDYLSFMFVIRIFLPYLIYSM